MENAVGPVLRMNDEVDLVVQAIEDDNPGVALEVIDRGAYVRVRGSGFLKVTRLSLEKHLGRAFNMRELEQMLTAFAGRIHTSSDEINWHLTAKPAAHGPASAAGAEAADELPAFPRAAAEASLAGAEPSPSRPDIVTPDLTDRPTGPNIPPSLHNRAASNGGN